MNIFYKNKIINYINCIFIILDEKKQLHKNGIIGFLVLMILFKIENLKDRINILYSSENSSDNTLTDNEDKYYNDIINEKNNYIILSEYYNNSAIIKAYNPKYFFLNNNIIYEKNTENEWKILSEEMKKIQNEIWKCIRLNLDSLDKNKADILFFITIK